MQGRSPTVQMPAAKEVRRPPIPQSEIDRDLRFIARFVSEMKPRLSAEQAKIFDDAAKAAEDVSGIRPYTEFMSKLGIDFFPVTHKAYESFKADENAKLVQ